MTLYLLMLLGGVLLAWFGGEIFVNGGVGLARLARWPTAVIGVTVAAFGTSSPELMVAVHAAMDGVPEISLGDVLGSNVVNVALVLGLVLCLSGMKADSPGLGRDWTVTLMIPPLMYVLLMDGWFSRLDAAILMIGFFIWLGVVIKEARAYALTQAEVAVAAHVSKVRVGVHIVGGLLLLIGAAQLVVHGGKGVATALGWSPFVVGAVVIALATSTPELATTLISRLRGHDEVGLGNILGSSVFNVMFIAAVAALIQPYSVRMPELAPSLIFGVVTVLFILPDNEKMVPRWRGFILLGLYALYMLWSLQSGGGAAVAH